MTEKPYCFTCHEEIKDEPYSEIEETQWENENEGKSFTRYYHNRCRSA